MQSPWDRNECEMFQRQKGGHCGWSAGNKEEGEMEYGMLRPKERAEKDSKAMVRSQNTVLSAISSDVNIDVFWARGEHDLIDT